MHDESIREMIRSIKLHILLCTGWCYEVWELVHNEKCTREANVTILGSRYYTNVVQTNERNSLYFIWGTQWWTRHPWVSYITFCQSATPGPLTRNLQPTVFISPLSFIFNQLLIYKNIVLLFMLYIISCSSAILQQI